MKYIVILLLLTFSLGYQAEDKGPRGPGAIPLPAELGAQGFEQLSVLCSKNCVVMIVNNIIIVQPTYGFWESCPSPGSLTTCTVEACDACDGTGF